MPDTVSGVRSSVAHMQVREILAQPVSVLLGVTSSIADLLKTLGIETVFDLGASALFAQARTAARATDPTGAAARFGDVPGDWLATGQDIASLDLVAALDLGALRALTAVQASALQTELDIRTIGELAAWPPYATAAAMVSDAVGTSIDPEEAQGNSLRPRFGEFPTERVYYSTLVLLHMDSDAGQLSEITGPLSINRALQPVSTTLKPAVGAWVRFAQSWYAQGVTLGQMLHSLALAPGEATRIAVIDWSRVTSASTSESIGESEGLSNVQTHSRAISEVQNAVANEMQQGGSESHSTSTTKSMSASAGLSGPLGALTGSIGGSIGKSTTTVDASSSSWSLGSRSVTAEMSQNVADRTQQHSTLVRNRRATAIREVSQSEHEQVSTRIVANYNHMHALTVQYYEVVQIYRVTTDIRKVERVLLIPMQPVDFRDETIVNGLRGALLPHALSRRAAELLADPTGVVELRPITPLAPRAISPFLANAVSRALMRAAPAVAGAAGPTASTTPTAPSSPPPSPEPSPVPTASPATLMAERDANLALAAAITGGAVSRPGSQSYYYPAEVEIAGIRIENLVLSNVTLVAQAGERANVELAVATGSVLVDVDTPRRLSDYTEIAVTKGDIASQSGVIRLVLSYRGRRFDSPPFRVSFAQGREGATVRVVAVKGDAGDRMEELKAHLMANQGHYTVAAFRTLDSTALAALLSDFSWNGQPLVKQIEPRILSVAGNYLVFPAPVSDEDSAGFPAAGGGAQTWEQALQPLQLRPGAKPDTRLIPIPTAGVFAEAVLGRSNSAEKIDLTRFWNWQDSPPPFAPPEIAPVATGTRAQAETLMPGHLGAATLGIAAPGALPDPTGVGAILTAVGKGDMFRDMSGLAGTQALATANLQASGAALKATIEASTEAMKIASDLRKQGKEEEAKKVEDKSKKDVEAAQQTHDESKAKAKQVEDKIAKIADAAIAAGTDMAKRISEGKAVPGEPPPTETARGGRINQAEKEKAATPAPARNITAKKLIRTRFRDLHQIEGEWTLDMIDLGFPSNHSLRRILPVEQDVLGAIGDFSGSRLSFTIPAEREYKGPIKLIFGGFLRVDDPSVLATQENIWAALSGADLDQFQKLMHLPDSKSSTVSYLWDQTVDVSEFLKAHTIEFSAFNAAVQRLKLKAKLRQPGDTPVATDVVTESNAYFPFPEAAPNFLFTLTTFFKGEYPAGGSGPGDYKAEIERILIPEPKFAGLTVKLE